MDIKEVKIYSDLEEIYTKLLVEKINEFLSNIIGKSQEYSAYIKSITLTKKVDTGEGINNNHFMNIEGYDPETKEIRIQVNKKLPLVYESLVHEIQHAKNSGTDYSNLVLRKKYPFSFNFIDEYLSYKEAMNYIIKNEGKKNENIKEWYINEVKERNKEYEEAINENISYLGQINLKEDFNENILELSESSIYNNVYSLAYMLSKIRVIGIEYSNSKFRKIIKELDKIEGRINNMDCVLLEKAFKKLVD